MNGVVDRIEVQLFRTLSDIQLVFASTCLCQHTFLEVRLGVPYALTEQLCELSAVLCLFVCVLTEGSCDLGITLAVCLTSHRKVLSYFGCLAHEVCAKTVMDNRIFLVFCYA